MAAILEDCLRCLRGGTSLASGPERTGGGARRSRNQSLAVFESFNVEKRPLMFAYSRFKLADRDGNGGVDRKELFSMFGLQHNPFAGLLFRFFDSDGSNTVGFREFVYGLSCIHRIGGAGNTQRGKLKFAFSLFDTALQGSLPKATLLGDIKRVLGEAKRMATADPESKPLGMCVDGLDRLLQLLLKLPGDVVTFDDFSGCAGRAPRALLMAYKVHDTMHVYSSPASVVIGQLRESGNMNEFLSGMRDQGGSKGGGLNAINTQRQAAVDRRAAKMSRGRKMMQGMSDRRQRRRHSVTSEELQSIRADFSGKGISRKASGAVPRDAAGTGGNGGGPFVGRTESAKRGAAARMAVADSERNGSAALTRSASHRGGPAGKYAAPSVAAGRTESGKAMLPRARAQTWNQQAVLAA